MQGNAPRPPWLLAPGNLASHQVCPDEDRQAKQADGYHADDEEPHEHTHGPAATSFLASLLDGGRQVFLQVVLDRLHAAYHVCPVSLDEAVHILYPLLHPVHTLLGLLNPPVR